MRELVGCGLSISSSFSSEDSVSSSLKKLVFGLKCCRLAIFQQVSTQINNGYYLKGFETFRELYSVLTTQLRLPLVSIPVAVPYRGRFSD